MWPWFDDVTDFEICQLHKKNLDIFLQIKKIINYISRATSLQVL